MHNIVDNLISIKKEIQSNNSKAEIVAVSKTFPLSKILPLINFGHKHYGENKIQEAVNKWTDIKKDFTNIKLHFVGKLQTNKVKFALKVFDFIHSLDSQKLAKKISEEQKKQNKKPKIFIQINLGEETQKSGINKENLLEFYKFSKDLGLNIIGIMCIPPFDQDSSKFFSQMSKLNEMINLREISMGMSSDYLNALEFNSTYLRIGSNIFGKRD